MHEMDKILRVESSDDPNQTKARLRQRKVAAFVGGGHALLTGKKNATITTPEHSSPSSDCHHPCLVPVRVQNTDSTAGACMSNANKTKQQKQNKNKNRNFPRGGVAAGVTMHIIPPVNTALPPLYERQTHKTRLGTREYRTT